MQYLCIFNRSGDTIGSVTSNKIAAILDFTDRSNVFFSVNLYQISQLNKQLNISLQASEEIVCFPLLCRFIPLALCALWNVV